MTARAPRPTATAANAGLVLAAGILAVFGLYHSGSFGGHSTAASVGLCVLVYGGVAVWLGVCFRAEVGGFPEALTLGLQSLAPRLGGTGAVSLVILASSRELLEVVVRTRLRWAALLLLAACGYLLLELARRMRPLPPARRLALQWLDIASTALAHSTALALLAEGSLRKVLDSGGLDWTGFHWTQSAKIVAFVLSLGLVLHLLWPERSVTEPL